MNIKLIGKPERIMYADCAHNYFAWPSLIRLRDGRLAAACSGYRVEHICPFGKAVISYSSDDGKTFTSPEAVIDTVLDDRDAGLCAFGENGIILTSFNNSVEFQRENCCREKIDECYAYLDTVKKEDEEKALGSEFRISFDGGKTWGEIHHSPITSPHGPTCLPDGRIIWVGRVFDADERSENECHIQAWEIFTDGKMKYIGGIENIYEDGMLLCSCEPHAVLLPDGRLLCHIRIEHWNPHRFTTYQSVSADFGKTWSKPEKLLPDTGGAPAHILVSSSGDIISVYGYREKPYGIRAMISRDGAKTWEKDKIIYEQTVTDDIGYPETAELSDGTFLTAFYAHESDDRPAEIFAQKWKIEE